MKITDYIAHLEDIMAEHGNLEVETTTFDLIRVKAPAPKTAFRLNLFGRQSSPKFWSDYESVPRSAPAGTTKEDLKGDMVVRV